MGILKLAHHSLIDWVFSNAISKLLRASLIQVQQLKHLFTFKKHNATYRKNYNKPLTCSQILGKLTYGEIMFFDKIFPETLSNAQELKQKTIGQANNKTWLKEIMFWIIFSNAHKRFIPKKNFETLDDVFLHPKKNEDLPKSVHNALKYGTTYEPVAK